MMSSMIIIPKQLASKIKCVFLIINFIFIH